MHQQLFRANALLLTAAIIGCGGSSSSSSGTASTSSPATSSPAAAPDPGGQVVAPGAGVTVQAQLDVDAHPAFRESVSASDLVVPEDPALSDRAFAVEDDGTVRILDLSGQAPQLDRAVALFAAPLAAGSSTGSLRVQDASRALVTTSGAGAEGVAVFDPLAAQGPSDVTWFDLSAETVTWPAGTTDSAGTDVSGTARAMNFTADASAHGSFLFVAASNLNTSSWANEPGTLTAYAVDLATGQRYGRSVLQTSAFNPTAITPVTTPQGEVLLVTNSGAYGTPGGSIDVVDPVTVTVVGTIPFPTAAATNPNGRIAVSPDGRRGYVGSQALAEVYVLDLEDIGLTLGNTAPADLSARYLGGYTLPSAATSNYVSSVALSHTGNYLYAVSFNESALYVIDLLTPGISTRVDGFQRTGDPANFEGLLSKVAVRPGIPGVDYQGPSILGLTINLAAADRTLTNVSVSLDTVTVDQH